MWCHGGKIQRHCLKWTFSTKWFRFFFFLIILSSFITEYCKNCKYSCLKCFKCVYLYLNIYRLTLPSCWQAFMLMLPSRSTGDVYILCGIAWSSGGYCVPPWLCVCLKHGVFIVSWNASFVGSCWAFSNEFTSFIWLFVSFIVHLTIMPGTN